jgi:hypothetical protein
MSIVFLFDENPDVASAGSGGAAVGGAVGSRWQPVFDSSGRLDKIESPRRGGAAPGRTSVRY